MKDGFRCRREPYLRHMADITVRGCTHSKPRLSFGRLLSCPAWSISADICSQQPAPTPSRSFDIPNVSQEARGRGAVGRVMTWP